MMHYSPQQIAAALGGELAGNQVLALALIIPERSIVGGAG